MGWFNSLFGNPEPVKSPADRWLDLSESAVGQIMKAPQAVGLVTVDRDMGYAMGAVAFAGFAFAVTGFTDPANRRYYNFIDSIRETAIARYGERYKSYLAQCTHFTADCNSVSAMSQIGSGSLLARLVPALMVLNSIWLVEALGGNPGVTYRFVPAKTPKTMFSMGMRNQFEAMLNAFVDLS